jgi:hypothetical protein
MGTWISTAEVEEILGVNPARVRRLLLDKKLIGKHIKVGRRTIWQVSLASVLERKARAPKAGRQPKHTPTP